LPELARDERAMTIVSGRKAANSSIVEWQRKFALASAKFTLLDRAIGVLVRTTASIKAKESRSVILPPPIRAPALEVAALDGSTRYRFPARPRHRRGLQLHPDPFGFATIRATPPCDAVSKKATLSYRRFPAVGSIIAPARGGYSSIPTQLGSRQLEPPRRATPSCPFWQLATLWDLVFCRRIIIAPARGDYSSIPTLLGSRQLEPPRRTTPNDVHWQLIGSTIPPFFESCNSSTPWFRHRATRGDYSPNAAPTRVTEPPRRSTPSGDQRRKWGTLCALTLPALSPLRDRSTMHQWKPPPTEETVLEETPIAPPPLPNWLTGRASQLHPPTSPGRDNAQLRLPGNRASVVVVVVA
jgi:hypothetical protein